ELPAWLVLRDAMYGVPNIDFRGVKISCDRHGPRFDPDTGTRVPNPEMLALVREYLGRRLPAMKNATLVEARVCQYENTSNGDLLLDRHPDFDNVWIAGGGSGHGFKHGPMVGKHLAGLITGRTASEPKFSLATKATIQQRAVY
ncbi:MAG TPA: FAD-dependent oxidoreductase, partial [Terriglobales bacterium]|nr:FAD-dependent oxidoreductase [Terriglobales bacterium]